MSTNIKRALVAVVVVDSTLNAINNYDVFLDDNFTLRISSRIILTYITPFCVSLFSSIKASKS